MVNNYLMVVLMPLISFIAGVFFIGLKRKIIARIQRRYGPPLIQPLYDIIKLLSKKENISHGVMFDLGPVILLGAAIMTVQFIPVPGANLLSGHGDLLALIYISVVGALGMALGAGEAANPNASIGIARALSLMFGYELPFAIVVATLILRYNTTNITGIISGQSYLHWGLFFLPLTAIAGFISIYGAMGEHPFDVVVAPQEIASGPMVEYGGKHLGFLMIDHMMHTYIELALFVDLFLGGASNWLFFVLKMLAVLLVMTVIESVMPRFRMDSAIKYFMRWPTALALIGLLIVFFGG